MRIDQRRQFGILARASIEAGLLTNAEARLISRAGTRKVGYWARHVLDLVDLVAERMAAKSWRGDDGAADCLSTHECC